MRVLVTVRRSPPHSYLVHLFTKDLIKRIRKLVDNNNHHKACIFALEKGIIVREVTCEEVPRIQADLILSENNARWDLIMLDKKG